MTISRSLAEPLAWPLTDSNARFLERLIRVFACSIFAMTRVFLAARLTSRRRAAASCAGVGRSRALRTAGAGLARSVRRAAAVGFLIAFGGLAFGLAARVLPACDAPLRRMARTNWSFRIPCQPLTPRRRASLARSFRV